MRRPAAAAAQGKVFFWRWGRPGRRGSSVIDYITCTEKTVFIFHNVDVNCKLQHPNTSKTSFTPSHMCYSQELKDTQRRTRVPSRDKEWQDPGAKERQGPRTKERCATQGTPAGPRVYLRPWTPDLRVHLRLWRRTIRVYLRPQNARAQATP